MHAYGHGMHMHTTCTRYALGVQRERVPAREGLQEFFARSAYGSTDLSGYYSKRIKTIALDNAAAAACGSELVACT